MASKASTERSKRNTELIANFRDGFADGWHMAVAEFFKAELDIKFTERVVGGEVMKVLTQGPYYSFKEGQILYDKREGYSAWETALKYLRIVCKITNASPRELSTSDNISKNKNIDEGFVEFTIYTPNNNKSALVEIGEFTLSQSEFVDFLKFGKHVSL